MWNSSTDIPGVINTVTVAAMTGAGASQAAYIATRSISMDTMTLVGVLALVGAVVGLGQALAGKDQLSLRRVVGKALHSIGVAMVAALVYAYRPETEPAVIIGVGALLSVLGSGILEEIVRKRFGLGTERQTVIVKERETPVDPETHEPVGPTTTVTSTRTDSTSPK